MALQKAWAANTQCWGSSMCRYTDTSVLLSSSENALVLARIQSPGCKQKAGFDVLWKNSKTLTIHRLGRVTLHNLPHWNLGNRTTQAKWLRCGNFFDQHAETKQSGGLGVFLLWASFSVCARGFICHLLDLLRARRSAALLDVFLCCPADSAVRQKRMASAQFLATVSSLLPLSV